jgi:CheY-specific phosphatase CheX
MIGNVACAQDLNQLIEEMWLSMAGMTIVLSPQPQAIAEAAPLYSCVHIAGAWEGAVQLAMTPDFARETTSRLIGVEEPELSQDSIRDAAGELANMVGGGVKAFLPSNCSLSLPTVVMGNDFQFSIGAGRVVFNSGFVANSGAITVTVIEREAAAVARP